MNLIWLEILIKACVLDLNLFMFFLSSSKLVNRLCYVYIYSFLNLGIVVHSIVIVGTLIFFLSVNIYEKRSMRLQIWSTKGLFRFFVNGFVRI